MSAQVVCRVDVQIASVRPIHAFKDVITLKCVYSRRRKGVGWSPTGGRYVSIVLHSVKHFGQVVYGSQLVIGAFQGLIFIFGERVFTRIDNLFGRFACLLILTLLHIHRRKCLQSHVFAYAMPIFLPCLVGKCGHSLGQILFDKRVDVGHRRAWLFQIGNVLRGLSGHWHVSEPLYQHKIVEGAEEFSLAQQHFSCLIVHRYFGHGLQSNVSNVDGSIATTPNTVHKTRYIVGLFLPRKRSCIRTNALLAFVRVAKIARKHTRNGHGRTEISASDRRMGSYCPPTI